MGLHVRHLLEGISNPMMLVCLIALLIVLFANKMTNARLRQAIIGLLVVLLVFSTGCLPRFITQQVERQYASVEALNSNVKWVVVLGGGHARGKLPSHALLTPASLNRVMEGVRLVKLLPHARLVLSGGGYDTTVSEAAHMAEIAKLLGVPDDRIILEEASINTADQANLLANIVGREPFYLVTSAFHMKRSMYYCEAKGLHPIPAPTDYTLYWEDERFEKFFLPQAKNMTILAMHWREWLGLMWARFKISQ